MATQVERAVRWAHNKIGSNAYNGMCQKFVASCYAYGAGMPYISMGSANNACEAWKISESRTNIPTGAAVYFTSPTKRGRKYGHVGLYVGGGYVIHTWPTVKKETFDRVLSHGCRYKGWGWNGGRKPTGAGAAVSTPSVSGGGGGGNYTAQEPPEPQEPKHIPQTKKVYTIYEDDNTGKMPDVYRYVWYSLDTKKSRDISDRLGSPELEDDPDSVCLTFTFNLLQGINKFIKPVDISCGDFVSVENTSSKECIFLGQVQEISGNYRGSYSVTCQDEGRVLSNEVIMQFSNIPASRALSQIGNKLGIQEISCPDLVSSVYGIRNESASSIAKTILETVTAENGVPYFIRMVGKTLVIKSYSEKCIRAYHRPAENVHAFDVFDEAGEPSIGYSITNLKNKILVYTSEDNAATVEGKAQDDASIKKYGLRQGLETFSDKDGVSASVKAKNVLKQKNKQEETLSMKLYGSDKIMVGARFKIKLPEIEGEFWVDRARHEFGPPHMVDVDLVRCY